MSEWASRGVASQICSNLEALRSQVAGREQHIFCVFFDVTIIKRLTEILVIIFDPMAGPSLKEMNSKMSTLQKLQGTARAK